MSRENEGPLALQIGIYALFVWMIFSFLYIKQIKEDVRELRDRQKQILTVGSLELQGKCAMAARREFESEGYTKKDLASQVNHYNPRLGRCFMEVDSNSFIQGTGQTSTSKNLFDAFEGRLYGNYYWLSVKDKKYWEVPPRECKVTDLMGTEKTCASSDGFDELAKAYLR